jgi:hypothetical protein
MGLDLLSLLTLGGATGLLLRKLVLVILIGRNCG